MSKQITFKKQMRERERERERERAEHGVTPTTERLRQEDLEFKASLAYIPVLKSIGLYCKISTSKQQQ
jgi:hypothetical protein